jgi:hypothetical protein
MNPGDARMGKVILQFICVLTKPQRGRTFLIAPELPRSAIGPRPFLDQNPIDIWKSWGMLTDA